MIYLMKFLRWEFGVFWKECMSVQIQSVDMDVWDAVVNGRFQLQIVANGEDDVVLDKPIADWSDDDKKKV